MFFYLLLSFIFFILGLIHLNWGIGGKFGFNQSLPTKENGERVLNPKKIDSIIVGMGLLFLAFFYISLFGLFSLNLPEWLFKYGSWGIPSFFTIRAIGDFHYVGFFKKIKQTEFSRLDSKLFSPLCLIIAIIGFVIAFNHHSFLE